MQTSTTKDGSDDIRGLLRVGHADSELDVSVRTVWRLISIGELEKVHIGKSVRVKRASLLAFIAKGGAR